MVETRKGILRKAKLALRPMTIVASLTRRQGPTINVPLCGPPLTPLQLVALEVCLEPHEKALDTADDVIHGTFAIGCSIMRLTDSRHQAEVEAVEPNYNRSISYPHTLRAGVARFVGIFVDGSAVLRIRGATEGKDRTGAFWFRSTRQCQNVGFN